MVFVLLMSSVVDGIFETFFVFETIKLEFQPIWVQNNSPSAVHILEVFFTFVH